MLQNEQRGLCCTRHVVAELPTCYALGVFDGSDAKSFVVGPEKKGPIERFALDGSFLETVASGPGGVMTLEQVPTRDDQLLATRAFYSPNAGGDEASIVSYTRVANASCKGRAETCVPGSGGGAASSGGGAAWDAEQTTKDESPWRASLVCNLPYVHRFGMLEGADSQWWLLASTIKGACRAMKDDWRTPGAVYAGKIDRPFECYDEQHQLDLTCIASAQVQNHGFLVSPDRRHAFIATAAGVFRYTPPASGGDEWDIACLIVQPTSDMAVADFDGDGKDEILTISPFHGDTLRIWHVCDDLRYELVWEAADRYEFLHAIWAGVIAHAPGAIVGNRGNGQKLLHLWYDGTTYCIETIDCACGPANCSVYVDDDGAQFLVATHRETDVVALYAIS